MIIGWIRLAFFVLIGSSIAYVALAIYFRSTHREELEKQWARSPQGGDRDSWIEAGMARYQRGLKRRLLWLIYVLPFVVFTATYTFSNWDRL